MGNLRAFEHTFKRLNLKSEVAASAEAVIKADALILPGVGSFDWAMTKLNNSGLREALEEKVLRQKTPILGVCVGMQILSEKSEEGRIAGLGWIEGETKRLGEGSVENEKQREKNFWPFETNESKNSNKLQKPYKLEKTKNKIILPHMGWNTVNPIGEPSLFHEIKEPQYYFLHSYYFAPRNPSHVLGTTKYGFPFASAVCKENIFGVQFHPEKSHQWGMQMLKNFFERC